MTDHIDIHAHISASIWSITSAKENVNKHSLCTYMHISYECRYIHADITHTHTGAIKTCFMTLMNGLWILYPFRWDQKWVIAGRAEGHTQTHVPLTCKLTSTDISTLYCTIHVLLWHACMQKCINTHTQGSCLFAWGSPVCAMINRGGVAPTLYLILSLCWSWENKQAVSFHDTDKKNSLGRPASLHTVWAW